MRFTLTLDYTSEEQRVLAEYLRVWRPRRRGLQAATRAAEPPGAVMAEVCHTAETLAVKVMD